MVLVGLNQVEVATITGGEAVWTGAASIYATSITPLEKGMQYLLTVNVTQASTNGWNYYNGSGYVSTGITGTGIKTAVLTFAARQTSGFYLQNGDGTNGKITDITLVPLGLLLAPDAYQAGGGTSWYDTSGNSATITLPASGVTWNVPSSQQTASGWTFGGNLTVGTAATSASSQVSVESTGLSTVRWYASSDGTDEKYWGVQSGTSTGASGTWKIGRAHV